MLDYQSIAALAAVVREGSFEQAGAALGITPSAVSQRVRGLEEKVGSILVVRGQPCIATDVGRRLCAHFDQVRLLEHELDPVLGRAARRPEPAPTVAIAVNADSLATWFHLAAAECIRKTGASLDIKIDDEARTADHLRSGSVLAAVSASAEPVQGCRTIALGMLPYVACASPDRMADMFANGVDGGTVARSPHLRFDRRDQLQSRWARDAHGIDLGPPVCWAASAQALLDLILAGTGWGTVPLAMAAPHLEAGRLVELPPCDRPMVQLHWTVVRLRTAVLDDLTASVRAAAGRLLVPPRPTA